MLEAKRYKLEYLVLYFSSLRRQQKLKLRGRNWNIKSFTSALEKSKTKLEAETIKKWNLQSLISTSIEDNNA